MALPEGEQLGDGTARLRVAISPDGRTIAYVGGPSEDKLQLWVRRLDQLAATPLAGTEGAYNPAFSPDGTRIAYLGTQSTRVLRVVPVSGGPSITVADSLVDLAGVSWGYDGYIYYDGKLAGDGIARVRETGGNGEVASMPDSTTGEAWHGYPSALPNGRGVLLTVGRPSLDEYEVAVLDTRTGTHKVLVRGVAGRYASSGHLVYVTAGGALMAAPFDAEGLRLTGEPVPIMEGVFVRLIGRAEVEIAANGTLVYVAGGATTTELTWLDRAGSATPVDTAFGAVSLDCGYPRTGGRQRLPVWMGASNRSS